MTERRTKIQQHLDDIRSLLTARSHGPPHTDAILLHAALWILQEALKALIGLWYALVCQIVQTAAAPYYSQPLPAHVD